METAFAYAQTMSLRNSIRSSSISWQLSQNTFQSCSHLPTVSLSAREKLAKSRSLVLTVCWVRSSLRLMLSRSLPWTRVLWAVKELMRMQSASYFSRALLTCVSCACFTLNCFSIADWTTFRCWAWRATKALAGPSRSLRTCWASWRWNPACFSVSERRVSSELRSSLSEDREMSCELSEREGHEPDLVPADGHLCELCEALRVVLFDGSPV